MLKDFNALKITLASPKQMLSWSNGEVKKAETINYRTQRAEVDGLFCEKIFGPTKNYECYCGKYKKVRYKGIICDKCGVEVTHKKIRRERMGHIALAAPVVHIWFSHGVPNKLALLLGIPGKKLSSVIYFSRYAVLKVDQEKKIEAISKIDDALDNQQKELTEELTAQVDALKEELKESKKILKKEEKKKEALEFKQERLEAKNKRNIAKLREEYARREQELIQEFKEVKNLAESIKKGETISEEEYVRLLDVDTTDFFEIKMGAEAIKNLLEQIDLDELEKELKKDLNGKSAQKIKVATNRLKIVEGFKNTNGRPEWLVLDILPVISPELRPIIQLAGGRYATSDLNDLYRRVINRNNRLKRLMDLGAPEIILRNEKRMLQESVDALIDNQHRPGNPVLNARRLPYKSLADMLRGKKGRFRQNLLGKRVDYSGRSVIVVGPDLNIDQCGLPKKVALELFRPFVIREIIARGLAPNIKSAKFYFEEGHSEVWDILEEVIKDRPVLLNRAPTLHKQGIQAFYPILSEGNAIRLHPMVCGGFNADFDGDQMAVHVPLSKKAVEEAKNHMFTKSNIIYQSDGSTVVSPDQDMVYGIYYLTNTGSDSNEIDRVFKDSTEVVTNYDLRNIGLRDKIAVKVNGKIINTTAGRIIFNEILPEGFGFVNKTLGKKELKSEIIGKAFEKYGDEAAIKLLDAVKNIGLKYATYSGFSVAMDDCAIIPEREAIVNKAEKQESEFTDNYMMGLITYAEKRRLTEKVWLDATSEIASKTWDALGEENSIVQMVESGSRGSKDQIKQISGMRGLLLDPSGHFVEVPIKSNFKLGLDTFEYFIGSRGTRKGLADTALKTSESGYLTRRLVDVSSDMIIAEDDCGHDGEGFELKRDDVRRIDFIDRIFGRWTAKDVKDKDGKIIVEKGTEITAELAKKIDKADVDSVNVRSPLTCKTYGGVCKKCYGYSMATLSEIEDGIAVGVVAAQAMGEAATQLTLDTFHFAGGVSTDITQGLPRVEELFEARTPKRTALIAEMDGKITLIENKGGEVEKIRITQAKSASKEFELKKDDIPAFKRSKTLKPGDVIYTSPKDGEIKAESRGKATIKEGKIVFKIEHLREKEYDVRPEDELLVAHGDNVTSGTAMTKGSIDPKELMTFAGIKEVQKYLIDSIQEIYSNQGIALNDKHTEVVVRQMTKYVRIIKPGDTNFSVGEFMPRLKVEAINADIKSRNLEPAIYRDKLLGITMSSLRTESWLSATSFERQVAVLTDAAIQGKIDYLHGLKENVIIGRLIPVRDLAKTRPFEQK